MNTSNMNTARANQKIFPTKGSYLGFMVKACIIANLVTAISFYLPIIFHSVSTSGDISVMKFLIFPLVMQLTIGNLFAIVIGFIPALVTAHIINIRANLKQPYKEAFITGTIVIIIIYILMFLIPTLNISVLPVNNPDSNSIIPILLSITLGGAILGGVPAALALYFSTIPVLKKKS